MPTPTDVMKLLNSENLKGKVKIRIEDIYSYFLIQDLVKFSEHFPITTSSLRFHTLATILNDIIVYNRKSIIEFGSGISTLAIANLIKKNKLHCDLVSVEDNKEWYEYIKSFISRNDLGEKVKLIYAPLEKSDLALENNFWYSVKTLDENKIRNTKFDLAIIDGPGAWKPEIRLSRYPAIPYLMNSLTENYSIYFDDVNRKGEKEILKLWQQKFNLIFERINDTSAVFTKGKRLNTIP